MAFTSAGFPSELVREVFVAAQGKSSIAKLAKQTPIAFSGTDIMTFTFDGEVNIVAEGAAEKVAPQDTVWVNYKGTLLDGTVFDQNDSTQFVANRVIKGWTEGLGLLGEGGEATLYIPAELAYGERGAGADIGPNEALEFKVELLDLNPKKSKK